MVFTAREGNAVSVVVRRPAAYRRRADISLTGPTAFVNDSAREIGNRNGPAIIGPSFRVAPSECA